MAAKKQNGKKNEVKIDFTKGVVADAIAKDVAAQIAGGKATWATWRRYVELVANGNMTPDHAKGLLLRINAKIAEHRKANGDTRPVADLKPSRISEAAGILRLGTLKCWPRAFDAIKELDVNRETLNTMSKFVRGEVKGDAKNMIDACPEAAKIMRVIAKRKATRRGAEGKAGKRGNGVAAVRNPETNLDTIKRNARSLAKWFGKDKGATFIAAILKAVDSARPMAKAKAKADKAEAAEA